MGHIIEYDRDPLWYGHAGGNFYHLHRAVIKSRDGAEIPGYALMRWGWLFEAYPDSRLDPGAGLPNDSIIAVEFARRDLPPADTQAVRAFVEKFASFCEEHGTPVEEEVLSV